MKLDSVTGYKVVLCFVFFCEDCQILEQVAQRGCGFCDPGGFQSHEIPGVNSVLTLLCGGGWTS